MYAIFVIEIEGRHIFHDDQTPGLMRDQSGGNQFLKLQRQRSSSGSE
jgi:hypothetical protein